MSAELAILRLFTAHPEEKVIYIAPLKALVRERIEDWGAGLCRRLGKKMVELTGEMSIVWGCGVVGLRMGSWPVLLAGQGDARAGLWTRVVDQGQGPAHGTGDWGEVPVIWIEFRRSETDWRFGLVMHLLKRASAQAGSRDTGRGEGWHNGTWAIIRRCPSFIAR